MPEAWTVALQVHSRLVSDTLHTSGQSFIDPECSGACTIRKRPSSGIGAHLRCVETLIDYPIPYWNGFAASLKRYRLADRGNSAHSPWRIRMLAWVSSPRECVAHSPEVRPRDGRQVEGPPPSGGQDVVRDPVLA